MPHSREQCHGCKHFVTLSNEFPCKVCNRQYPDMYEPAELSPEDAAYKREQAAHDANDARDGSRSGF